MGRLTITLLMYILVSSSFVVQAGTIRGTVRGGNVFLDYASVGIPKLRMGTTTDSLGHFVLKNIPPGVHRIQVSYVGYQTYEKNVKVDNIGTVNVDIELVAQSNEMNEVVVTGTMRPVSRKDSPIPVEVVTSRLFKKNPTPSLFEAVGMVNGVKPQINCNVCNTGDIHINGMEGPYTMMLIDGMPIVSSLSTVYGLSGIPTSIVDRIEVVKGPASSLYGSEAMGGIINVITKEAEYAPLLNMDVSATTWQEYNIDGAFKFKLGKKVSSLLGVNYFNFTNKKDKNHDNFTDVTLQRRISIFNKWNIERADRKQASFAARYVYEDRWGGEMNWNKSWRGSDSIYAESIYTNRLELIGVYQLPVKENIFTQVSYNYHKQDSWYGNRPYMARQQVFFAQAYWDKPIGSCNNLLLGAAFRYTYYDDNTPATKSTDGVTNEPDRRPLPGLFIQDEWRINDKSTLLAGYRYDYDKNHGSVHSPRLAYRLSVNRNNTFRASFGTGFRVVNLFTEDHSALTGAREVVIKNSLNPERSYNGNLNYVLRVPTQMAVLNFDLTGFYSYFTNKIIGDFDTDPNKIIYDNLDGHAVSQGLALNIDASFNVPLTLSAGVTYADVFSKRRDEDGIMVRRQELHAPKWTGVFTGDYRFPQSWTLNVTGDWTGPMRLPILPNDYRPEYSPWFCIVNMQLTKSFKNGFEIYGGVKNIFNFVPKEDSIMRPFDPFDKHVDDPVNNPHGYTFDTEYNYASLQGIRGFLGIRFTL